MTNELISDKDFEEVKNNKTLVEARQGELVIRKAGHVTAYSKDLVYIDGKPLLRSANHFFK